MMRNANRLNVCYVHGKFYNIVVCIYNSKVRDFILGSVNMKSEEKESERVCENPMQLKSSSKQLFNDEQYKRRGRRKKKLIK